ncbi:hypothetical protein SESBI_16817 [Sesbania bispinosa]|nr:hypothetical protein SESBI_16817 [Sesbania bispinosa]
MGHLPPEGQRINTLKSGVICGRGLAHQEDKVKAKLDGWKETLLNQGGKEVLIKVVIQAIPVYAMSIVKFPATFYKKLGALVARFWWRGPKKDKGIHWKSWKLISKSKYEGGPGFKDFSLLNTALLSKQAWRIVNNPTAYRVQILKAIYFPNSDFLQVQRRRNSSWVWASLMHGRQRLKRKEDLNGPTPSSSSGANRDVWQAIWKADIPQKIKLFV